MRHPGSPKVGLAAVHPVRITALSWNPVAIALTLLGAGAVVWLPFLRTAQNRMVSGEPVSLLQVVQSTPSTLGLLLALLLALLLVNVLLGCLLTSVLRSARAVLWLQVLMACALIVLLVVVSAGYARQMALAQSAISRTSLGAAFWSLLVIAWLMAADALQRLRAGAAMRVGWLVATSICVGLLLASGWCDELSIMKEYANRSDLFGAAVLRHLQIVLITLVITLCLGLPIGWWIHQRRSDGAVVFPLLTLLNVIQTIPSIALFGLLMAPLALLAASFPALAKAGISGVGMAPGVIALVLYSLLPVVRGTLAGLEQVPSAVVSAALGMGLSRPQIALQVQLPLALPVVLSGLRTATIAAVGMTTITALIGAGGLGAIMFEGLFSSAQDLVLLGVLPIVVLAVLADMLFKGGIRLVRAATNAGPLDAMEEGVPA